ncbi:MAG: AAA family ATPase [Gammaproteobacteria bacterium]
MRNKRYYRGLGERRSEGWRQLPEIDPDLLRKPEGYLAAANLSAAVDVALTLGMPLLLTGEPGCGKSQLAHSIAWELDLGEPLEFNVKSDTQGRDLFYGFDTLGRFHAAHSAQGDTDPRRFVSFNALGKAILYAKFEDYLVKMFGFPAERIAHPGKPRRSVVLIDEIDKAPKDVPNDILAEIETLRFRVPEIEAVHGKEVVISLKNESDSEKINAYRPIVIITSNSEKALPDAFLRRCVYFDVPFPPFEIEIDRSEDAGAVSVEDIVKKRLGARFADGIGAPDRDAQFMRDCLDFFAFLRLPRHNLEKKPSLAELLSWIEFMLPLYQNQETEKGLKDLDENEMARFVEGVKVTLFKNRKDQQRAPDLVAEWKKLPERN